MGRGRVAVAIDLSVAERRELDDLARRRRTAQGLARRARIVLLAAEGLENKTIAAELGASADTVGIWRRRFAERDNVKYLSHILGLVAPNLVRFEFAT